MYQQNQGYDWDREQDSEQKPERKDGILKKTVLTVAGALLFGTVSGSVMIGINVAAARMMEDVYAVAQTENIDGKQEIKGTDSQGGEQEQTISQLPPVSAPAAPSTDVSDIVEQAMPSVVAITSTSLYQTEDFGYGWFFGGGSQTYEIPSTGSGIIIGENETELLLVTNNHVVADSSSLKVAFIDDQAVDAAIKGTDEELDLAVLAVLLDQIPDETRSKIKTATLGNSDDLKVGEGVVAIGNALGYGQSVTVGYVSALDREVRVSSTSTRILLQTDAAINPGNSGGALLNMQGQVIGINAAKYSSTEVEGIGYAIPISKVEDSMSDLMNRKTRTAVEEDQRGYLGIQGTTVDIEASQNFGMPEGVYVSKILEQGAAWESGLKEKDIIVKLDGQTVKSMTELQEMLTGYSVGEQIELTVQRQEDGQYKEHNMSIILKAMPKEQTGSGQ